MNGYFVLFVALCISAVAAYYSIVGLATIFAAAAIPVIIMGSTLEVAKLVTASWLYTNWNKIPFLLKTYLTAAVSILMFITSMGIFGFLSKAHIEQAGGISQIQAQIDRSVLEIKQIDSTILRLENEIEDISTSGTRNFQTVQDQISQEQVNIDRIYARIQPEIERIQILIDSSTESRDKLRLSLDMLETAISENRIAAAQRIVGVSDDGKMGPQTKSAIEAFQTSTNDRIKTITQSIQKNAQRISDLRNSIEPSIQESQNLISSLRSQIVLTDSVSQSDDLNTIRSNISDLRSSRSAIQDKLFDLRSRAQIFEIEVGPVKYIAEFIYGDADEGLTEKAVRWVILIIIFVFDPLAVLLVIAANMTISRRFDSDEKVTQKQCNQDTYVIPSEFDINNNGDIVEVNKTKKKKNLKKSKNKSSEKPSQKKNLDLKPTRTNSRNIKFFVDK